MAANDLLSQEEIDALLHSVDDGEIATETGAGFEAGDVRTYDFTSEDRIVRGRMPTLEMINQRFVRYFRISLFNFLRRSAEITLGGVQLMKFSEYAQSLHIPSNLNLVRIKPLRGKALFVMDPHLVFATVDNFFGGFGQSSDKAEGREFTPTEMRVIHLLLDLIFKDLKEAWKPVYGVDFEYCNSEVNPHFATIVGPSEVIVVSTLNIKLESGGGDLHIAMPYSMIEPIRELLDAGTQSDRGEADDRWQKALKREILNTEINVGSILLEKRLTLESLLQLKSGDVIPVELPENVVLTAENIPVWVGKAGVSDGHYAIEILHRHDISDFAE
ncbi:MAG: flagellar motor switch protein FliM [Pseudomonadota bacterium]